MDTASAQSKGRQANIFRMNILKKWKDVRFLMLVLIKELIKSRSTVMFAEQSKRQALARAGIL